MRSLLGLLVLLAGLAGWRNACAAQTAGPSLQAVQASMQRETPQAALAKYFACDAFKGTGYERIAGGSAPWVDLAQSLLQYSDGCYTEGILSALGLAMSRSPRRVLPLVQTTPLLSADKICLPFISDELPLQQQMKALARSRLAISRVREPALKQPRAACLDFIRQTEATLRASASSTPR